MIDTSPSDNDVIEGAIAIGRFLWGNGSSPWRAFRAIRHGHVPVWRVGKRIFARRSTLTEWIRTQEKDAESGEGTRV